MDSAPKTSTSAPPCLNCFVPLKEMAAKSNLPLAKGTLVEVSSDEEGFKDAWFIATVVEPPASKAKTPLKRKYLQQGLKNNPSSKNVYLVQYHSLVSEEGSSEPLIEYVMSSFIRPFPPKIENGDESFDIGDLVDAYYRDGWWTGVVKELVGDKSRFKVFFQNPPEEAEFGRSELRLHQDWVGGKWVRPKNQRMSGFNLSPGLAVEVNLRNESCHNIWFPATIREKIDGDSFLVDYGSSKTSDKPEFLQEKVHSLQIRPQPPDLGKEHFVLLEKVDAYVDYGWKCGIITKVLAGGRHAVFFKHTNQTTEFSFSELRPHLEWADGKWISDSQEVVTSDEQGHTGKAQNSANNAEMDVKHESSALGEKEMNCVNYNNDARTSHSSKKVEGNALENLTLCQLVTTPKKMRTDGTLSGSAISRLGVRKATRSEPVVGNHVSAKTPTTSWRQKEACHLRVSGSVNQCKTKKKQGKLSQLVAVSLPASATGEKDLTGVTQKPTMVRLNSTRTSVPKAEESGQPPAEDSTTLMGDQEAPTGDGMELVDQGSGAKTPLKKRGRPPKITRSPKVGAEGEVCSGPGDAAIQMVIHDCASSGAEKPVSIGVELFIPDCQDKFGNGTEDGSGSDCAVKEVDKENSADKMQASGSIRSETGNQYVETETQGREVETPAGGDDAAPPALPFLKSSTIWAAIESMEAFEKLPQNPHFGPLRKYNQECREGLAIGSMVTFANLVEKTTKLQFDDPKSLFDRSLEALLELETLGFDVEPVRGRLNELLSIKGAQDELRERRREIEMQISERAREKAEIDKEVESIDGKIRELEEKRAAALSLKETKDAEIAALASDVGGIEERFRSTRVEYERVVSAPWRP